MPASTSPPTASTPLPSAPGDLMDLNVEGIPRPVRIESSFRNLSAEDQGRTVDHIRQTWEQQQRGGEALDGEPSSSSATFRVGHDGGTFDVRVPRSFLTLPEAEQNALIAQHVAETSRTPPPAAAPEDRSYSGAVRQSARNLTTGLGATARVIGNATGNETARGIGETLNGAVTEDPNYRPATPDVVEAVRRADVRRALTNLPRAVVENAGSLGATLLGGAAGGAIAGPPGAVLGAYASAGAQNFGQNVEDRATNNGEDPNAPSTDALVGGGLTTAAQAGLEALGAVGRGARLITSPLTRPSGVVARAQSLARVAAREGGSEIADQTVQQIGTSLGTERGLDIDPAEALAAGLIGTGTRGGMGAPGVAARGGLESSVRIATDLTRGEMSPDEAASVERINRLLSNRFDAQVGTRPVSQDDLLNGARTELDGGIRA